ncbi:MAG: polysaccharide ABC transporter ATP-binding protein [Methyloceanibacter sp.]
MTHTNIDELCDATHPDALVRVEDVSKRFCRSLKKSLWYGVQDIASDLGFGNSSHELRADEFWAVKHISFELRRGECLGLIGHNGAGKTTLLRMLSGLIKPDKGRIEIRGRVGGLIALGAGFNPMLTGRENIYVNASVIGVSKRKVDRKFDEIVDFAGIHEFIDAPVQSYSSGMSVRLGFAVAAILIEPDVLLLDEVLAVGDIGFIIKCLNVVRRLSQNSAVIFVSHSMPAISAFCTRVIVLEHGQCLIDTREPANGINQYYSIIKLDRQEWGTGEAKIKNLFLKIGDEFCLNQEPQLFRGTKASVVLHLQIQSEYRGAYVDIYIHDEARNAVISFPLHDNKSEPLLFKPGDYQVEIPLGPLDLNSGKYSLGLGVRDADSAIVMVHAEGFSPFRISGKESHGGKIVRPTAPAVGHLQKRGFDG